MDSKQATTKCVATMHGMHAGLSALLSFLMLYPRLYSGQDSNKSFEVVIDFI